MRFIPLASNMSTEKRGMNAFDSLGLKRIDGHRRREE